MTLFGIGGRRGIPASLGGISQQAIKTGRVGISSTSREALSDIKVGEAAPRATGLSPAAIEAAKKNPATILSPSTRDVLAGAMSPTISAGSALVPPIRFMPHLAPPPRKEYEQDTLRLSQFKFSNGVLQPVEKNGISVFRPEIISCLDFVSVTGNSKLGDKDPAESAEQLVKAQYQANEIRVITLVKLIQDLKRNREYASQLETIKKQFDSKMKNTRFALEYFSGIIKKIDSINLSLDPKKIPESYFEQEKYDSLQSFYEKRMQYSRNKFSKFSDTKILNQLISDLRYILEGYSFSLLDVVDYDRDSDFNSTIIDKSYSLSNNFSFSIESIKSKEKANVRMNQPTTFANFLNSLPTSSDDRIKLLISILSKELRVSKQMGIETNARILREKYQQSNLSNPFDNICGTVGDSIFDAPLGNNSLASLTYADTTDENVIILPFESVYVDTQNERKTYVPCASYFTDNLLNVSTTTGFNTQPFVSFASRFNTIFSDAKNIIETLLELAVPSPTMAPEIIFNNFLNSAAASSIGLANQASIDRSQAIFVSLVKLANSDTVLKNMVFEYFLLSGLASVSQTDQKQIFQRLGQEMDGMKNFSFSKFNDLDAPNLLGGMPVLRPYLGNIAEQIEDRVFSLLYQTSNVRIGSGIARDVSRLRTIPGLEYNNSTLFGGASRHVGTISTSRAASLAGVSIPSTNSTEISFPFFSGEIKETLINAVSAAGSANTNVCKEFIDLCVKFDTLASASSNPIYMISDQTFRTRFNFLSVSTQMVLVFEILSSVIQKYMSANFSKGNALTNGTMTIDVGLNSAMIKIIKDMTAVTTLAFGPDAASKAVGIETGPARRLGALGAFSIRDAEATRTTTISPALAALPVAGNPASRNSSFNVSYPTYFSNVDMTTSLNSPLFGFGRETMNELTKAFTVSVKSLELKKSLVINKQKLVDENKIVRNILHIFEVINSRLNKTKEDVTRAFTLESLNTFLTSTGLTVDSFELVKTPSQIRTSLWLYDQYDERLGDATSTVSDIGDTGVGFIVVDRVPLKTLANMFTTLSQPQFTGTKKEDVANRVKIITVGIPAGFSRNISDRVERDSVGDVNMDNKQFDVVNVCVYKRDARFDDIVFKPQKFIFDLSLFPIQNFLPASLEKANVSYGQLLREIKFRDYQTVGAARDLNIGQINTDENYNFLSLEQKSSLVKNHSHSQFLEFYIKFMTGLKITEEIFSPQEFEKISSQNQAVTNLIISYLKNVKRKNIPNQSFEQLLLGNQIDQETKDIIRILSYGNILFQGDFVKKRILDYKLFDRVFNIPLNLDNFEIDVEKTLETTSGRQMYSSANFQTQIKRVGEREYFKPKDKNEASFEDIFVVLESNLRSE